MHAPIVEHGHAPFEMFLLVCLVAESVWLIGSSFVQGLRKETAEETDQATLELKVSCLLTASAYRPAIDAQVGDVVRLNSGGPSMTATDVYPDDCGHRVWCVWHEKGLLQREAFPSASLGRRPRASEVAGLKVPDYTAGGVVSGPAGLA